MPRKSHKLKKPTANTINRLKEIKFYIIINALIGEGQNGIDRHDLFELIVKESGAKLDVIQRASSAILHRAYAPDRTEQVIACKHMGLSVLQTISTIAISNPTYYRILDDYIANDEFEFIPRLDKAYKHDIELFNIAISNMFGTFAPLLEWDPNA